MNSKVYSQADLTDFLSAMGLDGTETLMVHSSMKSIGQVDGGADTVLDALCDFFRDGLLVFPTFTYNSVTINTNLFFHRDNTPSCTGILTELFRKRTGVLRSMHPAHSLAAYGKDAADFVAGHEKCNSSSTPESASKAISWLVSESCT